ncbi:c-type cytochrome [Belliella sp. DSM 111904]|uniref:C-type cytochrome n=1 Tax=Belliella filtrata TaxID=2923435 RepID=A0ABS9UXT6_9BACT|nr:c-type cytochrome [Belliella filtrata]MCH7408995.1 c-type cytochrome [Belliella filtrata]
MNSRKTLSLGLVALTTLAFACGGGSQESTQSADSANSASVQEANISLEDKYKDDPVFITGSAKAKEAGCTACHMIERKVVGPSYADVAAKYENTPENVSLLADHVIDGNVGNWGEIQMPSHPHLERADVEDMIKYILLLKK